MISQDAFNELRNKYPFIAKFPDKLTDMMKGDLSSDRKIVNAFKVTIRKKEACLIVTETQMSAFWISKLLFMKMPTLQEFSFDQVNKIDSISNNGIDIHCSASAKDLDADYEEQQIYFDSANTRDELVAFVKNTAPRLRKIDVDKFSKDSKAALQSFSDQYTAGEYEKALATARQALEDFPEDKAMWHSQVGALTYSIEGNITDAFSHYVASYKAGFDAGICEDNIWEAAEENYNRLRKEDGTFNAILFPEDGSSIRADSFLQKYLTLFPSGKHIQTAKNLIASYEAATS